VAAGGAHNAPSPSHQLLLRQRSGHTNPYVIAPTQVVKAIGIGAEHAWNSLSTGDSTDHHGAWRHPARLRLLNEDPDFGYLTVSQAFGQGIVICAKRLRRHDTSRMSITAL
jgi:hypothetical protein